MNSEERHADGPAIELTLPLQPSGAAMLRTIAAAVGADAGFSVDEIDDLRLALNEAWALFLGDPEGARCTTVIHLDGGTVHVTMRADDARAPAEPDALASRILDSVVDQVTRSADRLTIVKSAAELQRS